MKKSKMNIAIILLIIFIMLPKTIYYYLIYPLIVGGESFIYYNNGFFEIYGVLQTIAFFTLLILIPIKLFKKSKTEAVPNLVVKENIPVKNTILRVSLLTLLIPLPIIFLYILAMNMGWEFFIALLVLFFVVLFSIKLFLDLKRNWSSASTIFSVLVYILISIFALRISYPILGDGSMSNWIISTVERFLDNKVITFDKNKFYDTDSTIFKFYALITIVWFFIGTNLISKTVKSNSNLDRKSLLKILSVPIIIILLNALTIVFFVKPIIEMKPVQQQLFGTVPRECYPSVLNVNGTNNYIWPDGCEDDPNVKRYMEEVGIQNPYYVVPQEEIRSVKLTVNGKENPDSIKYNSVFTLDFDFQGVTNCYTKDGPVPLYEERERFWHEEEPVWKDGSYVFITNMLPKVTNQKLIARDSERGYVPNLKLTLECDDDKSLSDTIIIPVEM